MFRDVMRSLVHTPVTERYPEQRLDAPPGLRAQVQWQAEGCTGCCLCVKDCPAQALEQITIDKAARRFVMVYHMDRCIFCGQCVQSCRFDLLRLASDAWELASTEREPLTKYYGAEDDVRAVLEGDP